VALTRHRGGRMILTKYPSPEFWEASHFPPLCYAARDAMNHSWQHLGNPNRPLKWAESEWYWLTKAVVGGGR